MTFTTDAQNVRRLQRHKLQEWVYREKIRTVEELQQRITEEWERLDQRAIDLGSTQGFGAFDINILFNCWKLQ